MIDSQNRTSDRYWFKDGRKLVQQQASISPTHSLCINCSDYYEIPPCQTNLNTDSGCFPSLINPERN
ncbi:hypothetical protein [Myxosarcina sp. GI1]|uniref:hypothetical protein n=1 Tax=Myxosarcina sp. GI1 TaxID=1541065 RepID=UPI00056626AC|nr:hypothetical protein [Myxosarcina sp. GI1]